jgi:hypothetical protein
MTKTIFTFIGVIIAIIILGFILVWPLTYAWNYVMPQIFGLPEITYWQMFALYVLSQSLIRSNVSLNKK